MSGVNPRLSRAVMSRDVVALKAADERWGLARGWDALINESLVTTLLTLIEILK